MIFGTVKALFHEVDPLAPAGVELQQYLAFSQELSVKFDNEVDTLVACFNREMSDVAATRSRVRLNMERYIRLDLAHKVHPLTHPRLICIFC